MGRLEKAALLLALAMAAAACGGDDERGLDPIETPTFEEDGDGAGVTTSTVGSDEAITTSTAASGASTTTVDDGSTDGDGGGGSSGSPRLESVSFDDPVGDATPGVGTSTPPAWTDLAGGSLERQGNAYRLTIRLGGDAPQTAPGRETMNVATFFDVDGDPGIEYELWVNLGAEGWGPVWYDDQGNAAPGEDSNVTVIVEGNEVRMLFPDVMIDKPNRLRFSMASEYGELAQIGSSFARRDDAPDNDQSVAFPS
jgi:hypothetical protein